MSTPAPWAEGALATLFGANQRSERPKPQPARSVPVATDGKTCHACGGLMQRTGTCHTCTQCAETDGCG